MQLPHTFMEKYVDIRIKFKQKVINNYFINL
jgi:hypothetical protein